jgi:broad specificity phosphatase PhoE
VNITTYVEGRLVVCYDGDMKKLYFVRHGQTDTNVKELLSGHIEAILTDEGKAQAVTAGKDLKTKHLNIDLIVCSPLLRAYDTACIIAKELDYPIQRIKKNPLFLERSFGVLEGTSNKKFFIAGKYKDIDEVEGAETISSLQQRAEEALAYIKSLPDENILLVGHGAFGRALRRVVNGEPFSNEYIGELKIINNSEIVELF